MSSENVHFKEKSLTDFLLIVFIHTFCLMIISLMSSRSPTITLCDFITRSSKESHSVSSVQARLKSARAGTSNSKEDGISSLEMTVSLVTTDCVTRVTVWPGASVFERRKKREKIWETCKQATFSNNKEILVYSQQFESVTIKKHSLTANSLNQDFSQCI